MMCLQTSAKNHGKNIEICFHKTFLLDNTSKWNIIQAYSIQTESYQQCPTFIGTTYRLFCKTTNKLLS